MCYNESQAETETEKKVKNAHSLDYTPPRIGSLRSDDGGKFDVYQERQPGTVHTDQPLVGVMCALYSHTALPDMR